MFDKESVFTYKVIAVSPIDIIIIIIIIVNL